MSFLRFSNKSLIDIRNLFHTRLKIYKNVFELYKLYVLSHKKKKD